MITIEGQTLSAAQCIAKSNHTIDITKFPTNPETANTNF